MADSVTVRQRIVTALDTLFKTILTTNSIQVTSFTVPLANMKISAVDGAAFIDCGALGASLLTNLGLLVTVTDSAGKKLTGYAKAAGTGETYGGERVSDPTFDTPTDWTCTAGASVAGGVATWTAASANVDNTAGTLIVFGELHITVITVDSRTGGSVRVRYPQLGTYRSTVNTFTEYLMHRDTVSRKPMVQGSTFSGAITSFSSKQVLTPAATGVTIVSAAGGTTFNWTSKDAAFNYADSSGYTVAISIPYSQNLGSNVFWWRETSLEESELPALLCRDTVDTTVRAIGEHEHLLTVEATIELRSSDTAEMARKARADIEKALGTNVSPNECLSGYAQDINPISSEVIEVEHKGIKAFGVALRFQVQYVTAPFDPYTKL